jgi:hypothetical protein
LSRNGIARGWHQTPGCGCWRWASARCSGQRRPEAGTCSCSDVPRSTSTACQNLWQPKPKKQNFHLKIGENCPNNRGHRTHSVRAAWARVFNRILRIRKLDSSCRSQSQTASLGRDHAFPPAPPASNGAVGKGAALEFRDRALGQAPQGFCRAQN